MKLINSNSNEITKKKTAVFVLGKVENEFFLQFFPEWEVGSNRVKFSE